MMMVILGLRRELNYHGRNIRMLFIGMGYWEVRIVFELDL